MGGGWPREIFEYVSSSRFEFRKMGLFQGVPQTDRDRYHYDLRIISNDGKENFYYGLKNGFSYKRLLGDRNFKLTGPVSYAAHDFKLEDLDLKEEDTIDVFPSQILLIAECSKVEFGNLDNWSQHGIGTDKREFVGGGTWSQIREWTQRPITFPKEVSIDLTVFFNDGKAMYFMGLYAGFTCSSSGDGVYLEGSVSHYMEI